MTFQFISPDKILLPITPETELGNLSQLAAERLRTAGKYIALAESCTGGLVAKCLTDIPGSSNFFECGVVSYSNRIKSEILGVRAQLIDEKGVVSPEVAVEMANGARRISGAALGIGITGVAGPGGDGDMPEGRVYIALTDESTAFAAELDTKKENARDYNRNAAALNALNMIIMYFDERQ